jgi:hypothetical protein
MSVALGTKVHLDLVFIVPKPMRILAVGVMAWGLAFCLGFCFGDMSSFCDLVAKKNLVWCINHSWRCYHFFPKENLMAKPQRCFLTFVDGFRNKPTIVN